jgi:hypothetical protein
VIRFGKPDERVKLAYAEQQHDCQSYLSFKTWSDWQKQFEGNENWADEVLKWIKTMNVALNRVGRPFGFRMQKAITHYVVNYPRVNDSSRFKYAFADQVEQKIIPKLRGIDVNDINANTCLDDIEAIIAALGDDEFTSTFATARQESKPLGMFQWRGVTRNIEETHN